MGKKHTAAAVNLLLLATFLATPLLAIDVYYWVDENGVATFSQWAPVEPVANVTELVLPDTSPPHDPDEDRYSIDATAQQTQSVWDEISKRQEARREQQTHTIQPVVPYQEPANNYPWPYWNSGGNHRPGFRPDPKPPRPSHPIARPVESLPFRKPDR